MLRIESTREEGKVVYIGLNDFFPALIHMWGLGCSYGILHALLDCDTHEEIHTFLGSKDPIANILVEMTENQREPINTVIGKIVCRELQDVMEQTWEDDEFATENFADLFEFMYKRQEMGKGNNGK